MSSYERPSGRDPKWKVVSAVVGSKSRPRGRAWQKAPRLAAAGALAPASTVGGVVVCMLSFSAGGTAFSFTYGAKRVRNIFSLPFGLASYTDTT